MNEILATIYFITQDTDEQYVMDTPQEVFSMTQEQSLLMPITDRWYICLN